MQKDIFSVQTISCVPRVFLPINIENNYIIKAFLSIVLKHGAKPRTRIWRKNFAPKHRKSQFDINLTVVFKSTQKLLFIRNFFDKICKMVTKKINK